MNITESICMVNTLLKGVETSIGIYQKEKSEKGYTPIPGYGNLTNEDSKESIKRRIMVAREELLKISKAL